MATPLYHIGIDPGASGGIAFLMDRRIVLTRNMPDNPLSLWLWMRANIEPFPREQTRICLEKVGGFIGGRKQKGGEEGAEGNTGSSMFTFGCSYGRLEMLLAVLDYWPNGVLNPTSSVWQKRLDIPPKGKHKGAKEEHKRNLRNIAYELYPDSEPTLQTADAILLAHYSYLQR